MGNDRRAGRRARRLYQSALAAEPRWPTQRDFFGNEAADRAVESGPARRACRVQPEVGPVASNWLVEHRPVRLHADCGDWNHREHANHRVGRRSGGHDLRLVSGPRRSRDARRRSASGRGAGDQLRQRRPGRGEPCRAVGQSRRDRQARALARSRRCAAAVSCALGQRAVALGARVPARMSARTHRPQHRADPRAGVVQPRGAASFARRDTHRVRPGRHRHPEFLRR